MDVVLGTDDAVAAKDRLYRALDKAIEHKESLEEHLASRWQDLFGAKCDLLLYDLTSTYFEGQAGEIPIAWALSNLIALLRWNLFTYRDLWQWIDRPFDTPPEAPPDLQPWLFLDSRPSQIS